MVNWNVSNLRRRVSAAFAVPALVGAAVLAPSAAFAATTETGPEGQELTVSETSLDPNGTQVKVTGTGYDENVGVYVALCVVPETGQAPGPCLGGVNMEGEGGASYWIDSNPPAYAEGLTIPYEDGSFEVLLDVAPDDGHTNCLDEAVAPNGCAISTRADHTRGSDRSADVLIPVTFDADAAATEPDSDEAPDNADPEPTEDPDETGADAVEDEPNQPDLDDATVSDGVPNENAKAAGDATTRTILIGAGILVLIAGASALAYSNRKKRQTAPANGLEGDESDDQSGDGN